MKKNSKILFGVISLFSLVFSLSIHAKSVTSNEYQAVIDTAYSYFNGAANGDQAQLAKAFDLEFGHIKMISIDKESKKETIRSLPLSEFVTFFKKATEDTWKADILSVDIVENKMAMVKLNFDTPKTHYIDYLVMYKRNGEWKIINKTFYSEKK